MYNLKKAKIIKHLRQYSYAVRFDSKSTSQYLGIDHGTVCRALKDFEGKGLLKIESTSEGEIPYKQVYSGTMLSEGIKRPSIIDMLWQYLAGLNLIAEIIKFVIIFWLTYWLNKTC